jgi:acetyltransferase
VDITGGSGIPGYEGALRTALASPWVHGVCILYCETAVTKPLEIADAVIRIVKESRIRYKPVIACFVGGEKSTEAAVRFGENSIPCYDCPSKTLAAFAALREHARFEEEGCVPDYAPWSDVSQAKAREIIARARAARRTALTEPEAKEVFAAYGLPVMASTLARTEDQAVEAAQQIGFPVVLKIVSPDILHKSDAGGVRVNIRTAEAVREAYRAILANAKKYKADADIHGILVYEMAPQGTEVICGSTCDPQFGPTVMFGLGGIFVEVLKDVTFRVAPISPRCGQIMMSEIRCHAMLEGVRGDKPRDQQAVAAVLSRLSQLVTELEDEIAETDANPVMVYEHGKGCRVVDARIILKKR